MLRPEEIRAFARVHFALMESLGDAKAGERSAAAALLAYEGRFYDGEAFPAVATVGRLAGLSERAMQGHVDRLIDRGRLDLTTRLGRSSVYRLRFPGKPDHRRLRRTRHTPAETAPPAETAHDLRSPPAPVARSERSLKPAAAISPPVPPETRARAEAAAAPSMRESVDEQPLDLESWGQDVDEAEKSWSTSRPHSDEDTTSLDPFAALEERFSEERAAELDSAPPARHDERPTQRGHSEKPNEGKVAAFTHTRHKPGLAMTRPRLEIDPALERELRQLPDGAAAVRRIAEADLGSASQQRIVEHVLEAARRKGLTTAAGFVRSCALPDEWDRLADAAEGASALVHDEAPEPKKTPPPKAAPDMHTLLRRRWKELRGAITGERLPIVREKLQRELAEVEAQLKVAVH